MLPDVYLCILKRCLDVLEHVITAPLLGLIMPSWPCSRLSHQACTIDSQKIYLAAAYDT